MAGGGVVKSRQRQAGWWEACTLPIPYAWGGGRQLISTSSHGMNFMEHRELGKDTQILTSVISST